jgi:putative ubiquitin-RnfH superfamily antitoxin RatB of RatAB toxin-antitoxin module
MRVTVVYSPAPRQVREWALDLPEGATLADALVACGFEGLAPHRPGPQPLRPPGTAEAGAASEGLSLAVWGRAQAPGHRLCEGDRVEVLRALRVDPKVARRERFQRQGARAAGLFARRR